MLTDKGKKEAYNLQGHNTQLFDYCDFLKKIFYFKNKILKVGQYLTLRLCKVVNDSSSHWTNMRLHPDILQYSLFGQSDGKNTHQFFNLQMNFKMKWDRSNSRKDAVQNALACRNSLKIMKLYKIN